MARMTSDIVEAAHAGRCAICDQWIRPGDAIVTDITDTDGEWVHVECAEDEGLFD